MQPRPFPCWKSCGLTLIERCLLVQYLYIKPNELTDSRALLGPLPPLSRFGAEDVGKDWSLETEGSKEANFRGAKRPAFQREWQESVSRIASHPSTRGRDCRRAKCGQKQSFVSRAALLDAGF